MSRSSYPRYYGSHVPDHEWLSQAEAARELRMSRLRIPLLLANDHLSAAKDSCDRPGVTVSSVVAEKSWRTSASFAARFKRLCQDILGWF